MSVVTAQVIHGSEKLSSDTKWSFRPFIFCLLGGIFFRVDFVMQHFEVTFCPNAGLFPGFKPFNSLATGEPFRIYG